MRFLAYAHCVAQTQKYNVQPTMRLSEQKPDTGVNFYDIHVAIDQLPVADMSTHFFPLTTALTPWRETWGNPDSLNNVHPRYG